MWDARKVSLLLEKAIGDWMQVENSPLREQIFEEISLLLQDVMQDLVAREGTDSRDASDVDTGTAIGRTLSELTHFVRTLRYVTRVSIFFVLLTFLIGLKTIEP